jgi:D-galacturonate reductase
MVEGHAVPYKVTASAGSGVATSEPFNMVDGTEDTITLLVNWRSTDEKQPKEGTAVYTASWTAPKQSEVHSQQYFHYLAAKGEIRVDQAHRGYSYTTDDDGFANVNPFYMKYTPDEDGHFDGQRGYGYVSLEKFIDTCQKVNSKTVTVEELDKRGLPTIKNTELVTAILEAGRRSLDEHRSIELQKNSNNEWILV